MGLMGFVVIFCFQERYANFIDLQDKLHRNLCRSVQSLITQTVHLASSDYIKTISFLRCCRYHHWNCQMIPFRYSHAELSWIYSDQLKGFTVLWPTKPRYTLIGQIPGFHPAFLFRQPGILFFFCFVYLSVCPVLCVSAVVCVTPPTVFIAHTKPIPYKSWMSGL